VAEPVYGGRRAVLENEAAIRRHQPFGDPRLGKFGIEDDEVAGRGRPFIRHRIEDIGQRAAQL